jgi:hypothetical protein
MSLLISLFFLFGFLAISTEACASVLAANMSVTGRQVNALELAFF